MTPNLRSFADELVKLAAFAQQEQNASPFDSAIESTMSSTSGAGAKAGIKNAVPGQTAPAPYKLAPSPVGTPNLMVDMASRSGP
jgi:hypothetical protein